jgi:hypothetical protein
MINAHLFGAKGPQLRKRTAAFVARMAPAIRRNHGQSMKIILL